MNDGYEQDDWVVEEGVRCVVAPCCAFTFDAHHTDASTGLYSCPCCAEQHLRAENERLREALRKVEYLGSQAQSNAAVHMGMIAREALSGSSDHE